METAKIMVPDADIPIAGQTPLGDVLRIDKEAVGDPPRLRRHGLTASTTMYSGVPLIARNFFIDFQ
jgi:hypothetical protein